MTTEQTKIPQPQETTDVSLDIQNIKIGVQTNVVKEKQNG